MSIIDPELIELSYAVAEEPLSVTFGAMDSYVRTTIQYAIVEGAAISAGILLSAFSWILITHKKTPLFILNQISLLWMVIRAGLYIVYLMGSLSSLGFRFTGVAWEPWHDFRVSVAGNVAQVLLITSVEASLVVQIYVVFKDSQLFKYGTLLIGSVACLTLANVALYIHSTVVLAQQFAGSLNYKEYSYVSSWVTSVPRIMFSALIIVASVCLIMKLFIAIRIRRCLGLKQFDSFHIVVIMSTQVMVVPCALAIANFAKNSLLLLLEVSTLLAVSNLPMTSLWASSANTLLQPTSCASSILTRDASSQYSDRTLDVKLVSEKMTANLAISNGDATICFGEQSDADSVDKILSLFENSHGPITTHEFKAGRDFGASRSKQ